MLAGTQMPVQAKQGDSCDDPITLTDGFNQQIMQAGTYWYVANTFDLPMAISFRPANQTAAAPYLELDFGCEPGVYDDPVLCNLFCKTRPAYISLPFGQTPPKSYDEHGNVEYRVAFGESYRNMLLSAGISYNIPVYIKATFYSGGTLEMEPDAFNNCMDGAKFMQLGDTVRVAAQDKERHVIVPYVQWQYDSIRYVWEGTKPCIFAVSNTCDFDPTDDTDGNIIDGGPSHPIEPGGQFKVSSSLLMSYVSDKKYPNEGGMYFAKFYSEEPGVMKIERIPAPAPSCGATLLRLGEEATLERNDSNTVYAMPSSWVKPMQFTSPTSHIMKMYVGKSCDFRLGDAIAVYQFDRIENGHQLDLYEVDLTNLWKMKKSGENYLYVRFVCSDKTTVRPALWTPSDCELSTSRVQKDQIYKIGAQSKVVYSLYYADWKGGDISLYWSSTQAVCPFYVADTCKVPNSADAPVFYDGSIGKKATFTIPQAEVDTWESKADPDGYLYIRFYSRAQGNVTISSTAPEEEDNPCQTYDSISEVVAWDSCFWRGKMYYESGRYTDVGTLDPETECYDSTFVLSLMIRNTSYETYEATECDSIVYHNKTYRESGVYKDTTAVTGGHRVITTMDLTVLHSTADRVEIKQYEPYTTVTGKVLSATGVYRDTIANTAGCDSVITYDLTIYKTETTLVEEEGCDSIVIDGVRYTATGDYTDTLVQTNGDRTIRTLRLTIGHTTYAEETVSGCEEYTSPRGEVYKETGDYTEKLVNAAGCDSIISLHVTISQPSYGEETLTNCVQYTSPWGKVYTESGEYTGTILNRAGCDSVVTLHLTIIPDCHTYDTVFFCPGQNTEHSENIGDNIIRYYRPYAYESPATWDYMEGVILERRENETLIDLARAEQNLQEHYTGDFTSVKSVIWSYCAEDESAYHVIEAGGEAEWMKNGQFALTVRFVCGQMFFDGFSTIAQSLPETEADTAGEKKLIDGQIVIIRNGVKYNLLGTKIE